MSKWKTVPISTFLKERKDRFKPLKANELNQKRLYKIDFSGNIHILDDKTTNTNMILIKKGDLVISGINVEKGAVAVYEGKEDLLATIHYSSYEFDNSKIDIGYFKWFLKSKQFKDIVNSQIRGGIKTELKPKKFLPLEIPLPDLPTQIKIRDKINNVVNEIMELRNLDESNEEFIDKLRQSILQEAVSGKLVPQNPNEEPAAELLKKIKAEKEKLVKEKKIKRDKPMPPISKEEIFDLCLSSDQKPPQVNVNWLTNNLIQFTSLSNDLRFLEGELFDADKASWHCPGGTTKNLIGVFVGYGAGYVNTISVNGRLILNNGMHRAYTLKSLGIKYMPAIVQYVSREEEIPVVLNKTEEIRKDCIESKRPPLLKDFFDTELMRKIKLTTKVRLVSVAWNFEHRDIPISGQGIAI